MVVFVSYAREDHCWFGEYDLIDFLERSVEYEDVQLWSDNEIPGGANFKKEIVEKIREADIAILLVSQDFLNSPFIRNVELPEMEAQVRERGMIVIPVLVAPCEWESVDLIEPHNIIPIIPADGPTPLINFVDNVAQWQHRRQEILQTLKRQIERVKEGLTPGPEPGAPTRQGPKDSPTPPKPPDAEPPEGRLFSPFRIALAIAAIVVISLLFWREWNQYQIEREVARNLTALTRDMPWLNWLVYDPTHWDPVAGKEPSKLSIRRDLQVLRSYGFDGLVTCGASGNLTMIPRIAHEEGFTRVIMGVWYPTDPQVSAAAIEAGRWVDGYCLGHRGLAKDYSFNELRECFRRFRRETGKPVTTSELVKDYENTPQLAGECDFLCPDAHVEWHYGMSPQEAWKETCDVISRFNELTADVNDLPVLFKMVSYPSDGASSLTPENQGTFYKFAVERSVDDPEFPGNACFAFLGAFDCPWKTDEDGYRPAERHTGLFRHDRTPKPVVTEINWEMRRR